jgi:heat shock protein HtpX
LLQLGLSRTREYDADLEGAALTGDPEGLVSALRTLERKQGSVWEGLFPAGRIPDPSLLRTHPRTDDRIRPLLSLASVPTAQIVV